MKVHLSMMEAQASSETGIGQVVLAQYKYLPKLGIELVGQADQADVVACHITKGNLARIDILHCHGLYFADITHLPYKTWNHNVNKDIAGAARESIAITVPANWVAEPFKRDMRIYPRVIGHGIDLAAWKPGPSKSYILYNKNREGDVCQSRFAVNLARQGLRVVSTFMPKDESDPPPTLTVTGTLPHSEMKKMIQNAGIYLATTLETFGIGTLEAIASGVPVLGFKWGGTEDIVTHKTNGYLVDPEDEEGLRAGAEYIFKHRTEMSQAALDRAKDFDWPNIMGQYADLYQQVALDRVRESNPVSSGTSVIITNYNYSGWVAGAIQSCMKQNLPPVEIIVVDDHSTDNSRDVIQRIIADNKSGIPIKVILHDSNQGVAAARNHGIEAAKTDFVTCLDADDQISPRFIEALLPALHADRGLGIAYGGLAFLDEGGRVGGRTDWPPEFSWETQSLAKAPPPSNAIPSACMFRKAMWARCGGIRQEYAPGEDAEFWTRGLSFGFTAARVTRDPIFWYRGHEGSASRTKKYTRIDDRMPWMRDREYPFAAPITKPVPVRSYLIPGVSVIIPVGPGHEENVLMAVESIVGQNFREWELIVVWDAPWDGWDAPWSGDVGKLRTLYPFVRFYSTPSPASGAGKARNIGLGEARAKAVFFLDADDYLLPDGLNHMIEAYDLESGDKYIYTDHVLIESGKEPKNEAAKEYNQSEWKMQHSASVLMSTTHARELLFDEELPSWEDWDFFIRAAINGFCGKRLPESLLYYHLNSGQRRMKMIKEDGSLTQAGHDVMARFSSKYGDYYAGVKQMGGCCGGNGESIIKAKNIIQGLQGGVMPEQMKSNPPSNRVRMEYIGSNQGAIGFQINGRVYRGGDNPLDRYTDALPEDVEGLRMTGRWRQPVNQVVQNVPVTRPITQQTRPQSQPPAPTKTAGELQAAAAKALEAAKAEFERSNAAMELEDSEEEPELPFGMRVSPMTVEPQPNDLTKSSKTTKSKKSAAARADGE